MEPVKAWLSDFFRLPWALIYWNARKSWFRLRGAKGQCPTQNPSDSGRGMETSCDAVLGWREPARFSRGVCPLLVRTTDGRWVCSVNAEDVRPFWGRALLIYGGVAFSIALLAGGVVYFALRGIGYEISPRQVFWPRAWHELAGARVELFVRQAEEHLQGGRVREAVRALSVANELAPNNYRAAMMLAQLYRAGNPLAADRIYLRMSQQYPKRRNETARVWFTSLLAQGRLDDVAELARRQLAADSQQASVWLHALIFCSRQRERYQLLEAAAADAKVPGVARSVARLEVDFRRAPSEERAAFVQRTPLPKNFPYGRLHRAELLIEAGRASEAVALLAESKQIVAGRDLLAAALAALAVADDNALEREVGSLLGPAAGEVQVALVAVHLVRFPNARLAQQLIDCWSRLPPSLELSRHEATLSVLCAVGVAGNAQEFDRVKKLAIERRNISAGAVERLENFFFRRVGRPSIEHVLAVLSVLPLDLNYALLERYWVKP